MKFTKELRNLSVDELHTRLGEFKKELLKLNAQVASGANIPNPGLLQNLKRNVARVNTLLREKEVPQA